MKKIPEWIYPLYKPSDKKVFELFIELGKGRMKLDDSEFIENKFFTPQQIKTMIKKGVIKEPYLISAWTLYNLKNNIV